MDVEVALLKIKQVGVCLYVRRGGRGPARPTDPRGLINHPPCHHQRVRQGELTDVEASLKAGKAVLDGLAGAESIVYSAYYKAASEYHKVVGPPHAFYKAALSFLAYTPVESLSDEEKCVGRLIHCAPTGVSHTHTRSSRPFMFLACPHQQPPTTNPGTTWPWTCPWRR